MSRNATVSLVSYCPLPGDDPDRLANTLSKMKTHVGEAAAQGVDLVAFPEICAYLGAPTPGSGLPRRPSLRVFVDRSIDVHEGSGAGPGGTVDHGLPSLYS